MKAIIKFSSGTGNTRFIATELQKELVALGHEVECSDIETETSFKEFDLLIVGGPIYAGNVPEKLIRYVLRKIPDSPGTNAIVYSTSTGLLNAHGVLSISRKLDRKGYKVVSNERFLLPRNFYFGHYAPMEEDYCKTMFADARKQITRLANSIQRGDFSHPEIVSKGILSKDLFAELFSVMAKFMGKSLLANENCTLCMKCVNQCPQKNIRFKNNRIAFGFNCMMCTRCIHGCPAHAIEYAKKTYPQYRIANYT